MMVKTNKQNGRLLVLSTSEGDSVAEDFLDAFPSDYLHWTAEEKKEEKRAGGGGGGEERRKEKKTYEVTTIFVSSRNNIP